MANRIWFIPNGETWWMHSLPVYRTISFQQFPQLFYVTLCKWNIWQIFEDTWSIWGTTILETVIISVCQKKLTALHSWWVFYKKDQRWSISIRFWGVLHFHPGERRTANQPSPAFAFDCSRCRKDMNLNKGLTWPWISFRIFYERLRPILLNTY